MFLEKSVPGIVGSYQSGANKAGEVLSFVIREVNTFTSVLYETQKTFSLKCGW